MFSFGSWILFTGIIRKVFDNIYILTIGKFFPAAELGFYTKAKNIEETTSQQLSQSVGVVAFPIFSHLQDDKERLRNAVSKFLSHTLIFTIPILISLIVIAKPFVILMLTEKWAPMIPYLQLFSILGILYPLQAINIQVLIGKGKSNLNFRLSMMKNSLRILNLIIMYRYGVLYIIIGQIIVALIAIFINTYYTHKLIDYGIIKQIKDIYKIILGGIIAGILTYIVIFNLNNLWLWFFIGGLLSSFFYIVTQYLFNKQLFLNIISLTSILRNKP